MLKLAIKSSANRHSKLRLAKLSVKVPWEAQSHQVCCCTKKEELRAPWSSGEGGNHTKPLCLRTKAQYSAAPQSNSLSTEVGKGIGSTPSVLMRSTPIGGREMNQGSRSSPVFL